MNEKYCPIPEIMYVDIAKCDLHGYSKAITEPYKGTNYV